MHRVTVTFTDDEWHCIEVFRHSTVPQPSASLAVRQMMRMGLRLLPVNPPDPSEAEKRAIADAANGNEEKL